jgi:hypothetical protein
MFKLMKKGLNEVDEEEEERNGRKQTAEMNFGPS